MRLSHAIGAANGSPCLSSAGLPTRQRGEDFPEYPSRAIETLSNSSRGRAEHPILPRASAGLDSGGAGNRTPRSRGRKRTQTDPSGRRRTKSRSLEPVDAPVRDRVTTQCDRFGVPSVPSGALAVRVGAGAPFEYEASRRTGVGADVLAGLQGVTRLRNSRPVRLDPARDSKVRRGTLLPSGPEGAK